MLTFVGQQIANALERKQTLDKLAEERERLLVTMRSIADGVVTTDVDQRILMMNEVAQQLCGISLEEARGKRLLDYCKVVDPITGDREVDPVYRALKEDRPIELGKAVLVTADSSAAGRLISLSASPIHDEVDSIVGTVLVFRDITARQKMEQEREKAAKLDSIGLLAGGIAHDFNNILTAVIGNISMAKLDALKESMQLMRLEESEKAALRAKDLTQQLLSFSKGGMQAREIVMPRQVIVDSADLALLGSNIARHYGFAEELWPIEVNETQISQAISNIVLNAVQAMPMGGNIWVDCTNECIEEAIHQEGVLLKPGNYLRINIKDEGIGIPKDIFTAYL